VVYTNKAPIKEGLYSQGIVHVAGDSVYLSGFLGMDGTTRQLVSNNVSEQASKALENIQLVVEQAGLSMQDVLKVTVLLANMNDFPLVNDVYSKFFTSNQPARACFAAVQLPFGALVEIDCVVGNSKSKRPIGTILCEKAPKAVGPYSHAKYQGDVVYVSGCIALDPVTNNLLAQAQENETLLQAQTRLSLDNMKAILNSSNSSWTDVEKMTVLVTNAEDFEPVRNIIGKHTAAMTYIAVKALPKGAIVEIECVGKRNVNNSLTEKLIGGSQSTTVFVGTSDCFCKDVCGTTITEQFTCYANEMETKLQARGSSLNKALKVIVYLTDISQYAELNEAYVKRFGGDKPPARVCFAVKALATGALLGMECVAAL
jgi:2-iminobutanoate/2-iminopropanoate deaminase